jgi:CheY-like chemotaxis protein
LTAGEVLVIIQLGSAKSTARTTCWQMSNAKVILVADDDENDVFFLRRAFAKSGLLHTIIHVSDGQKALEYLFGEGIYADRKSNPFPDLVLLDLKMPKTDGFDVLATLRSLPQLDLPIVVFSTSALMVDIQMAKKLGAVDYMAKPADQDEMIKVALALHERWLSGPSSAKSDSAEDLFPRKQHFP